MTDTIEDRIIEAMARAMCIADGNRPDADFESYPSDPDLNRRRDRSLNADVLWELYKDDALRQYRAYLAMQST